MANVTLHNKSHKKLSKYDLDCNIKRKLSIGNTIVNFEAKVKDVKALFHDMIRTGYEMLVPYF